MNYEYHAPSVQAQSGRVIGKLQQSAMTHGEAISNTLGIAICLILITIIGLVF
jgi:hypothetical protein